MRESFSKLRNIEDSIALTDRQRLLVIKTTELAVATVLRESWEDLKESRAVTEMIARRMFNHYQSQQLLKSHIGLETMTSASAILQQAVGTYLRAYLAGKGAFEVRLERRYQPGLQPDIAVEHKGKLIATVEVKTDLGWNREYISGGAWDARSTQCTAAGFQAAYLLILSNTNWSGFLPRDVRKGGAGVAGNEP